MRIFHFKPPLFVYLVSLEITLTFLLSVFLIPLKHTNLIKQQSLTILDRKLGHTFIIHENSSVIRFYEAYLFSKELDDHGE